MLLKSDGFPTYHMAVVTKNVQHYRRVPGLEGSAGDAGGVAPVTGQLEEVP